MTYWFEVIYYDRNNILWVHHYITKIYCRLPNYTNNLFYKAVDAFMKEINKDDKFEIQTVRFIKAVKI